MAILPNWHRLARDNWEWGTVKTGKQKFGGTRNSTEQKAGLATQITRSFQPNESLNRNTQGKKNENNKRTED